MQSVEETYSLEDYLAAIKRRKRMFFLVAVPIILIAAALALTLPNQFRSVARFSVDLESSKRETLEPVQVAAYADQYLTELRDQVLSNNNLSPFLDESGAFPANEQALSEPDRLRILREGFYFQIETQPVTTDAGNEVDIISGFGTGYEGADPEFAHRAALFFANSFIEQDRLARTVRASSTSEFLRDQIARVESQIETYEADVADFKLKNACCLPELKEMNMAIIQRTERDIEALQPRIRTLEQDRIFLQAQLQEIRQQSASTDRLAMLEEEYLRLVASYGPDHPDVSRVRREIEAITSMGPLVAGESQLTILRMELAEAQRRYTDDHPDVVRLKRQIAALEGDDPGGQQSERNRLLENPRYLQLRSEINAIETELAELRTRAPELREKIEEYERRLARTPQIESEYQSLNRKLDTARESFNNLQQRLVIARQTEALESTAIGARITEIRSAILPTAPSGPPRLVFVIVGMFLAGSFAVGAILVAEMLDTTIRSSKDIARAIEMVPMTTIPIIQNSMSRAAARRQTVLVASLSLATAIGVAMVLVAQAT